MNAGKVWDVLKQGGSLTQHQIIQKTGLNKESFQQVIGWLSRENKVRRDGEFYSLAETNLTGTIGSNAGVLVTVLEDLTESVEGLEKLTMISSDDFHQAVGWLAREGHFQPVSTDYQKLYDEEPACLEDHVAILHDEVETLSDEVISRNHIINELTRQLTDTQMKYMRDADVIEKLNVQLAKSHHHISSIGDKNSESYQKVQFLEQEVKMLHEELMSRNHIISELSRQLTNTQTTIISQADKLDRLQTSIGKNPLASSSVSESLRHRLHRITQLQKSLDSTQETPLMSATKLYDTQSPVLDISQSQSVSEEELREALQDLHQDIDQKISQKKPHFHDDRC